MVGLSGANPGKCQHQKQHIRNRAKQFSILNPPPLQRTHTHIESISNITLFVLYLSPPHPTLCSSHSLSLLRLCCSQLNTRVLQVAYARLLQALQLSLSRVRISHSLAPAPSCLVARSSLSLPAANFISTRNAAAREPPLPAPAARGQRQRPRAQAS